MNSLRIRDASFHNRFCDVTFSVQKVLKLFNFKDKPLSGMNLVAKNQKKNGSWKIKQRFTVSVLKSKLKLSCLVPACFFFL